MEKEVKDIHYLSLGLYAFAGIGIEIIYALFFLYTFLIRIGMGLRY